jgi:predicted GNAT family acetyltransferase
MSVVLSDIGPASPLFDEAVSFVKPIEWRAVSLASNLAADGKPSFPGKQVRDLCCLIEFASDEPARGRVAGILLRTGTGIVLHCIREGLDTEEAREAVSAFLARGPVKCVLGSARETRFFESCIAESPRQIVDYDLMRLSALPEERLAKLPAGLAAKRGDSDDADAVLPLQEGYEREEVIPPGDPFDRDACKANLKRSLERQTIILAVSDALPVAKAGTNARGFAVDQIGGVFTANAWRGKGLATAIVARLSRELMASGRSVVLFVKPGNAPAKRAYEKVGFVPALPFRIAYF